MAEADFNLRLSGDEALVLFDWLTNFNGGDHKFADQAEQRVLWDLEADLERHLVTPLSENYAAELAASRERVRDRVE
jgi:hypothetical protein